MKNQEADYKELSVSLDPHENPVRFRGEVTLDGDLLRVPDSTER